jgi:hypothetical protein
LFYFSKTDVCKKDILILLDTSYSIGRHHFDSAVKPFLKKLVKSSKLNVGPDGTQLALATFSNAVNTRLRFGFGIHTMVKDYVDYIDKKLIWSKVSGDRTMTGVGATIADTQVGVKGRYSSKKGLKNTCGSGSRQTLFFSADPIKYYFFNAIDCAILFSPGGCGLLIQHAKMASVVTLIIELNCLNSSIGNTHL